jgi:flagellar biosynthesis regulator FlaF
VLDNIQYSHAAELTSETRAKERLSDKLDRYIDVVQAAEMEKEDLRDAVIQLVEKGGSGFTYRRNTFAMFAHVLM